MINIKDKLKRTNIAIKRTNGVDVEYITTEEFEAGKTALNGQITAINKRITDLDKNIDDSFDKGYEQGVSNQKDKLESKTITLNGTYTKEDGWNKVVVNVSQPVVIKQPLNVTLKENGTYNYAPSGLNSAYSSVTVNVNVPNTGSGDDLDFTQIGYTTAINKEVNEMLKNDIEYAYNLVNNGIIKGSELVFAPSADYSNKTKVDFENCSMLQVVPPMYLPEVESMKGMFRFCYSLRKVYQIQAPKATSAYRMFGDCQSLKVAPYIYAPNLTNAKEMFYHCYYLERVPEFDTTNVTDMSSMFYGCLLLETVPEFDTTNVTDMSSMFYGCTSLETVPEFDTTNVTDMSNMFGECFSLQSLPAFECGKVENIKFLFSAQRNSVAVNGLKGFYNLKIDWNDDGGLACCPTLTYQSFMNVIYSLYNFRATGDTTTIKTLKIHRNTMDLLSDADIRIATDKGWVITA